MTNAAPPSRVVLVSGVSGAGRSSSLKLLEDLGYEAVDNIPLSLVSRLVMGADDAQPTDESSSKRPPLAIGVDIRTRDFNTTEFLALLDRMNADPKISISLLFLDCEDNTLGLRFEGTRRRHPLAADRPVIDGIRHERLIMEPVQSRADTVIDTTEFALGDLKTRLEITYGLREDPGLAIFVQSFSFKRGVPRDADLVFDVRFFKNPFYDQKLRALTGKAPEIHSFIQSDPAFDKFLEHLTGMATTLLPRYLSEGKSYLTIAFGCTGGRHRSVFLAEHFGAWLENNGWRADVRHRDLDKS